MNAVAPGYFRTPLSEKLLVGTGRGKEVIMRTPMNRFGELDELVGAADFPGVGCGKFCDRRGIAGGWGRVGERSEPVTSAASSSDYDALRWRSAARAVTTAFTSSCAASVIFCRLPSRKAVASTKSAPTPRANAPAAMNSAALAAFTPPVGISDACGNGALSDFRYFAPPTFPQGKIFTRRAPCS